MSTKIYYAYRMEPSVFSEVFLPQLHEHVFSLAAEKVKACMACYNPNEDKMKSEWEKCENISYEDFVAKRKPLMQLEAIFKILYKASKSNIRTDFDFDVSMNVWHHKNRMYCIMYGRHDFHATFKAEGVEEYPYWNNTDPPEGMSYDDWDKRGDEWDEIIDDWDAKRMTHIIIEAKSHIGLVKVGKRVLGPEREDAVWSVLPYEVLWEKEDAE